MKKNISHSIHQVSIQKRTVLEMLHGMIDMHVHSDLGVWDLLYMFVYL